MGYPEAEYAAQKVIGALSGGFTPSGILPPLPTSFQITFNDGKIQATIGGNRVTKIDNNVVSYASLIRVAFNNERKPLDIDDYVLAIDFDLESETSDDYSLSKTIDTEFPGLYYRIFAKSSNGIINDTNSASYRTSGTLNTVSESKYMFMYPSNIKTNIGGTNTIPIDVYNTLLYGYDDSFNSTVGIKNAEGTFNPFNETNTNSAWLGESFYKKMKPFVIDANGNAIEQLDADNFGLNVSGEESIVSREEVWDQYQGVYFWFPLLYFKSVSDATISYVDHDLHFDSTGNQYSSPSTNGKSVQIVFSEKAMPNEKVSNYLGTNRYPTLPHPSMSSQKTGENYILKNITPGFNFNGKTYNGIWIPCYYADENGKSWPKQAETLRTKTEIDNVMTKYSGKGNVKLFGGVIWETLTMLLTVIAKDFDLKSVYHLGFSNSSIDGESQPKAQDSIPASSGFSFSDTGWNKILNSYVLGSSPYFILDPYIKSRSIYGSFVGRYMYGILESTEYEDSLPSDTNTSSTTQSSRNLSNKWICIFGSASSAGPVDDNEITGYPIREMASESNLVDAKDGRDFGPSRREEGTIANRLPVLTGNTYPDDSVSSSLYSSKDQAGDLYSHHSIRGLLRQLKYSTYDVNDYVYADFGFRRAPFSHKDLGLDEFLSVYVPLKANVDAYCSEGSVAYATMVFPPDENYQPVIASE